MSNKHMTNKRSPKYLIFYILLSVFILGYLMYKGVLTFQKSLFVSSPDRINIVVYGPEASYYSFDTRSGRHYQIVFPPDLKVDVPGGYGQYRIGSLGKLAKLDGNAHLLEKTFASTTTTFIHYYFFPESDEVYYGREFKKDPYKPSALNILLSSGNASILDRIYLWASIITEKNANFTMIKYLQEENDVLGDTVFRNESFMKKSIGLLYQASYREEQSSVQLLYPNKFKTADRIGTLLEGNGIRVSDITLDINRSENCEIKYSSDTPSKTATDMAEYFNCPLTVGKTDVYDILFILGSREKDWEIN